MTRDEMKRMLSQVDERYIAELDESTAEDAESEVFEVHPETKRSFWRIPAAIAAAVLIGLIPAVSLFSGRDLPPEPETSAGSSEETLHTGTPVDRMTDEEVNACFTMEYLTSRPGGTMVDGTASIELCGQTLEVKQFWSNGTYSDLSYITGAELRSTATDLIVTIDVGFSEDLVVCAQDSLLPAPEYAHPGGYAIDFVGRYEEETGFASCDFYANGVHYSLESAQMTRRELLAMAFTLAGQHIPHAHGHRKTDIPLFIGT